MDVWHWADVQPQSVQEVRAERDRNFTWSSVVNLDGDGLSFVRLADESLETVSPAGASQWGIGRDPTPYEYEVAWGGTRADYYRVNLDTGERALLAQNLMRQMGASDDGTWWLYLKRRGGHRPEAGVGGGSEPHPELRGGFRRSTGRPSL